MQMFIHGSLSSLLLYLSKPSHWLITLASREGIGATGCATHGSTNRGAEGNKLETRLIGYRKNQFNFYIISLNLRPYSSHWYHLKVNL